MRHTIVSICILIAVTTPALSGLENNNHLQRIFDRCALEWRGERYRQGIDSLIAAGSDNVQPILRHAYTDKQWRQKLLVTILQAYLQDAPGCARRRAALVAQAQDHINKTKKQAHPGMESFMVTWRAHNELLTEPKASNNAKEKAKPEPIALPETPLDATPADLGDLLWSADKTSSRHIPYTAAVLQFHAKPELASLRVLMDVVATDDSSIELLLRAIPRIGKSGFVILRNSIATKSVPRTQNTSPSAAANERRVLQHALRAFRSQATRSRVAARALAHMGDHDATARIGKALRDAYHLDDAYIADLASTLADFGDASEAHIILDHLLYHAATPSRSSSQHGRLYDRLRASLLRFKQQQLLPILVQRFEHSKPGHEHIILSNLTQECAGVPAEQRHIAALREKLYFSPTVAGWLRLHQLTGEDILQELLRVKNIYFRGEVLEAALAMGSLQDPRAAMILRTQFKDAAKGLEHRLRERNPSNVPAAMAQTIRESGYGFDSRANDLAEHISYCDTLLDALRHDGSKASRAVLQQAASKPIFAAWAGALLKQLDNKHEELLADLTDDDRAVREAAAHLLAEAKDVQAVAAIIRAAARRRGPAHQHWRAKLQGLPEHGEIIRELSTSSNAKVRCLAESILRERIDPTGAAAVREALNRAVKANWGQRIISITRLESMGKHVAKIVTPRDIPLIEEACAFDRGVVRRGIAAFALAALQQERSMQILVDSFNMGSLGGTNPAAKALLAFGEAGAALAAKIPAAVPGEQDTDLQMTPHRGGTRVLVETGDTRGADAVLKGFATLFADPTLPRWSHRLRMYLGSAAKLHDPRLIDYYIRILDTPTSPTKYHHEEVIPLLAAYDDQRVLPMLVKAFKNFNTVQDHKKQMNTDSLFTPALKGITRRLGKETPAWLEKQAKQQQDAQLRRSALLGLAGLSYPRYSPYPANAAWSSKPFPTPEDKNTIAAETRKRAWPILLAALHDADAFTSRCAAQGLVIVATGRAEAHVPARPDAVPALTDWMVKRGAGFFTLYNFLAEHGDPNTTGTSMLTLLRDGKPQRSDAHLVQAIGQLKPPGAVAVLLRNIEAKAAANGRWYGGPIELKILHQFGEEGAAALEKLVRRKLRLDFRTKAATQLAKLGARPAIGETVEDLLAATIAAGPESPTLPKHSWHPDRAKSFESHCAELLRSLAILAPERAKARAKVILTHGPKSLEQAAFVIWRQKQAPKDR